MKISALAYCLFVFFPLLWFLLTDFSISIYDILASCFLDFLSISNVLHTTLVAPTLTPGYLSSLSLSPRWLTTFYPHLFPHMANFASTTLTLFWKPCFLFHELTGQKKKTTFQDYKTLSTHLDYHSLYLLSSWLWIHCRCS